MLQNLTICHISFENIGQKPWKLLFDNPPSKLHSRLINFKKMMNGTMQINYEGLFYTFNE